MGMFQQHELNVSDDVFNGIDILVAQTNGMLKPLVAFPGRGHDNGLGKDRIRDVDRSFLQASDTRQVPADLFDMSFDFFFRQNDMFADGKGLRQVDHRSAKKVGDDLLRGKSQRQAADTAEGNQGLHIASCGIHHQKDGDEDDHDSADFADKVDFADSHVDLMVLAFQHHLAHDGAVPPEKEQAECGDRSDTENEVHIDEMERKQGIGDDIDNGDGGNIKRSNRAALSRAVTKVKGQIDFFFKK